MNPKKSQPPVPSTSEKRLNALAGQCLAVATTASMVAACSGVPPRPESRDRCPPEVVRTMEENGLRLKEWARIWLEAKDADTLDRFQKGGGELDRSDTSFFIRLFENGPIISRVSESMDSGIPKGTLLYGYVWVDADPEYVLIRYTEALFPSSRKIPVCMLATHGRRAGVFHKGLPKLDGSKPKAAMLIPGGGVGIVDVFP